MYDTINFFIDNETANGNAYSVADYLTNTKVIHKQNCELVCGHVENYKCVCFPFGVVLNGSISKYLIGDNFQSLGRGQAEEAIEKLSDALHVDIKKAVVRRFDIGYTMETQSDVSDIIKYFGLSGRYDRQQINKHSLIYKTTDKALLFYDKRAEARAKRAPIPEPYTDNKPLLRYEMQHRKHLKKYYGVVTGATLIHRPFYEKVVKEWESEYNKIIKLKNNDLDMETKTIKTPKDLVRAFVVHNLRKDLTPTDLTNFLDYAKTKKIFKHPICYTRAKNDILELMKATNESDLPPQLLDVEQSIRGRARYCR